MNHRKPWDCIPDLLWAAMADMSSEEYRAFLVRLKSDEPLSEQDSHRHLVELSAEAILAYLRKTAMKPRPRRNRVRRDHGAIPPPAR